MKKNINLTDDLDNAFNKAIEPMEIEPSESVWKNVDAGLTQVENSLLKKKIIFWKQITVFTTLLLVAFGVLFFYKYSNPKLPNQSKITDAIKNISASRQEQKEIIIPSTETKPSPLVSQKKSESINTDSEQKEKNVIASERSTASVVSKNNSDKTSNLQKEFHLTKNEPKLEVQHSFVKDEIIVEKFAADVPNKKSLSNTNKTKLDSVSTPKLDVPIMKEQVEMNSSVKNNIVSKDSVMLPKCNEPLTEVASANTSKIPNTDRILASAIFSHFYVEGIFSPEITNQYLKDNNTSDVFTKQSIKAHEVNLVSHSEGIKIGYDINHWSIESGCIYYREFINILPTTISPFESNGQLHGSLVTSSGIVDIPFDGTHHINDSVDIKSGSDQILSFINIPLQLKYRFGSNKLSFYVLSGISANILIQEKTNIKMDHDDDHDDAGDRTIIGINGTKNVYFGYSLGIGASYKFLRGFYLNLEPLFRGAMSSVNKDTPIKTYPNTLGVGVIAGYHF